MSSKVTGDLLNEGLANIVRAGGCQCDPPGSGEEFCTSHCYLRAENERLRADIETWGRIWNDARMLSARVYALRDGTALL